jgi:small subunit ribosomal protein S8
MTDPIADMLVIIKNGQATNKPFVVFSYSKIKLEIAKILEAEGYLGSIQKRSKKNLKLIEVALVYQNKEPRISGIKRISKPSRRIYKSTKEIFRVKNGIGIAIYSTSKGLLSDENARKQKVGGELMLEIW